MNLSSTFHVMEPQPLHRTAWATTPFFSRRSCFLHLLICLLTLFSGHLQGIGISQAGEASEYQIKAAFLYRFATFVNWPSPAFTSTNGNLRVCIMGKDPFGTLIDTALAKKTIHDHPVEIYRNPSTKALLHCHLLYLTGSQSSRLPKLMQHLKQGHVLTVGENQEFLKHGGMIQLYIENQRLRFAINPDAIHQSNLKVSSKLLRLAKIVTS